MKNILNDNIVELFLRLLPVQIFVVIVSSLSSIINGLVTGNYLSDTAMAALGLVIPMMAFMGAIASIVSGGAGILCGNYMGKGDSNKVNQVYSISVMLLIGFSVILTFIGLTFADKLAIIFGANTQTLNDTVLYIRGICIGILPHLLMPCFMTFLQMCNKSNVSLIMTAMLGVLNAIFSLLSIHVFKAGIFGIGLATSLSKYATIIMIIFYFKSRSDLVSFKINEFDLSMAKQLLLLGFPASLAGILYAIRNVFINTYAGNIGGTSAVNSLAILTSFGGFYDSFNIAVGSTMTMLASVFVGEKDSVSLKRLIKVASVIGVGLGLLKVLYAFVLGKWTATAFGANEQLAVDTTKLIIYYSFSAPLNMITLILLGIHQCNERIMLCNIIYLINCIIVPFICCILSKTAGITVIWSCYYLAEVVSLIVLYIISCIKKKALSRNIDDLIYLDKSFSLSNKYSMSIKDMNDTIKVSKAVEQFCRKNNIDERRSMLSGLCLEEMAGNVVDHGFEKDNKENVIDILAIVENDEVLLRLRDNCVPFNPCERKGLFDDTDPCKNIGIRMVSKIAKQMSYHTTFGMNVLSIKL